MTHHEIYTRFNGTNQVLLSKEYNMSVQHIYLILKEAQKREIDERQPNLFGFLCYV